MVEALVIPPDLQQALDTNLEAGKNFNNFSRTVKKNILYWIDSAKRQETRLNRINKTALSTALNQNPLLKR